MIYCYTIIYKTYGIEHSDDGVDYSPRSSIVPH